MITNIVKRAVQFTGKEDVVVLPIFRGSRELHGPGKKLDVLCRSALSAYIRKSRFSPDSGETALVGFDFPKAPRHVLLLGLGEPGSATPERLAAAAGSASKAVRTRRFRSCHVVVDPLIELDGNDAALRAFLKGFLLAQYSFSLKTAREAPAGPRRVVVLTDNAKKAVDAMRTTRTVAEQICYARDLVNRPAGDLTPRGMADEAKKLARDNGLECRVMGRREMEKLGMGAVLGVAQGSRHEPYFIELHYGRGTAGRDRRPKVCLVGKGVTFDSGGISIKPWQNMNEMKGDMAGGAIVMAVMAAASRLRLPVEIVGLIPCVENMPDGTAFRPGDVVVTHTGKTIEVISTDAEGRLILADALGYSLRFKPDVIIDAATLTGSVSIALGTRIAGVLGNDQRIVDLIIAAGRAAGEPVWQLPLDESFTEMVKGDISDYKNFAGKDGSTITAAALLGEFVGGTPWVHIDIAGTSWTQDAKIPYQVKGATGYGVDLLARFLALLTGGRAESAAPR
jgi:leucyl aminopeptidase